MPSRRPILPGCLAVAFSLACGTSRPPATPRTSAVLAETDSLVVTRPTVVAYLVIPAGAVDTSEALAVTADDWNYSMASFGDSLAAQGVAYALSTGPRLRIVSPGTAPATFELDEGLATGYVFARPGEPPCIRRGPADPDVVLAAARVFFGSDSSPEARARAACGPARR